jgi:hypothetical protein
MSAAEHLTELHTYEELIADQRENFKTLLCDDFHELLQSMDSPHVSRQWGHPIEATDPMKRQRLCRNREWIVTCRSCRPHKGAGCGD